MTASYTVASLRAELRRYLAGETSRRELREWLLPLTWSEEGEAEVVTLAWDIELLFMEAVGSDATEEELRAELRPLAGMDADTPAPAASASG